MRISFADWKCKWLQRPSLPLIVLILVLGIMASCLVLIGEKGQALDQSIAAKQDELVRVEALVASRPELEEINRSLKQTLASYESRVLFRADNPDLALARVQSHLAKTAQTLGVRLESMRPATQTQRQGYKVFSLELTMVSGLEDLIRMLDAVVAYEEPLRLAAVSVNASTKSSQQTLRSKMTVSGAFGPYEPPPKGAKAKGSL